MAFIPVPDCVEAVLQYDLEGATASNVIHVAPPTAGPYNVTEMTNFAEAVAESFAAEVVPVLSSAVTFLGCSVQDLTEEGGYVSNWPLSVAGGGDAASLPPGSAIVVSLKSPVATRNAQGRMFLPGAPENSVVDNGALESAFRTAVNQAVVDWRTALFAYEGRSLSLVVASKYDGTQVVNGKKVPIPRAEGIMFPVTSFVVRQYIKSQRRRNLKG